MKRNEERLLSVSERYLQLGKYDEAALLLGSIATDSSAKRILTARMHVEKREFDQAYHHIEIALEINPLDPHTLGMASFIAFQNGHLETTLDHLIDCFIMGYSDSPDQDQTDIIDRIEQLALKLEITPEQCHRRIEERSRSIAELFDQIVISNHAPRTVNLSKSSNTEVSAKLDQENLHLTGLFQTEPLKHIRIEANSTIAKAKKRISHITWITAGDISINGDPAFRIHGPIMFGEEYLHEQERWPFSIVAETFCETIVLPLSHFQMIFEQNKIENRQYLVLLNNIGRKMALLLPRTLTSLQNMSYFELNRQELISFGFHQTKLGATDRLSRNSIYCTTEEGAVSYHLADRGYPLPGRCFIGDKFGDPLSTRSCSCNTPSALLELDATLFEKLCRERAGLELIRLIYLSRVDLLLKIYSHLF